MKSDTLSSNHPTISASAFSDDAPCTVDDRRAFDNQDDHINLWNGSRLTKFRTWFEFSLRNGRHYKEADVWFWPVT